MRSLFNQRKKLTKKGQLTIMSVMNIIILVIFMSVATYIVADIVDPLIVARENSTLDAIILAFVIPVMWLVVIVSITIFASPRRPEQQY